jgi:peptidoglycan/LPS O-acetylase OafA/YrhL
MIDVRQVHGRSRESALDVLRFLAAASVMLYHFGFRGSSADALQDLAYPELAGFAKYGYLGVPVFFMISGYVIPWSIRHRRVADFAVSRAIRLFPTYWLCAALLVAVPPLLGEWRFHLPAHEVLLNVTMVAPWFGARYIDPVFWTLAIELQFYVVVACAAGVFGFRRMPQALLVWLALGTVSSAIAKATDTTPIYLGGTYYMYFCFGAACYFLHHVERSPKVYALAGVSLPLVLAHSVLMAIMIGERYNVAISLMVVCVLILAGAAAIFFSRQLSERLTHIAALGFLGGLTYPLYLLHENIGYALLNTTFSHRTRWLGLACTVALCLVLSAVVYVWFDLPVRRWLRGRSSARRATVPPTGGTLVP